MAKPTAATAKPATAAKPPALVQSTALATVKIDMQSEAAAGFEGATKDSYAIPFLSVLQSNSPQCKKSDGAFIKGAEEGMFLNTVTGEIMSGEDGVLVVPCAYKLSYIEWGIRNTDNEGFKGEHDSTRGSALMQTATRTENDEGKSFDMLPNGNQLVPTHAFFVLLLGDDGQRKFAVVSMSSTQVKKSKRWMTAMSQLRAFNAAGQSFQPPMYSHIWRLRTAPESKGKNTWSGWDISMERALDIAKEADASLYIEARNFYHSINKGEVKVQQREEEPRAQNNAQAFDDPDSM